MNSTATCLLRSVAALALCFSITSCGDDPELVRKREEQRTEIRRLDGELKILQEKISQIPADRSADLAKLKDEAESQKEEIASLEEQIRNLQADKAKVEKEHDAYKRKYVIR